MTIQSLAWTVEPLVRIVIVIASLNPATYYSVTHCRKCKSEEKVDSSNVGYLSRRSRYIAKYKKAS